MCHRAVIEISDTMVKTKATASPKLQCILILKYFTMTSLNWAGTLLSLLVGDPCSALLSFASNNSLSGVLVN